MSLELNVILDYECLELFCILFSNDDTMDSMEQVLYWEWDIIHTQSERVCWKIEPGRRILLSTNHTGDRIMQYREKYKYNDFLYTVY